jgi:MFS family permease
MTSVFHNLALKILLFTNGLVLTATSMLGPIYAIFVDEIGGNILDAGVTVAVYAATAGVTSLLVGHWVDRVKEKELVIVLGYVIIGTGFLMFMGVQSIPALILVQMVIGFGEALYNPAFDAVYSQHLDKKKTGIQWGAWEAMDYFTWAIGALIGGWFVSLFGFKFLFLIMAILAFSAALYIFFTPRKVL